MTSVALRDIFQNKGTMALNGVFFAILDSSFDGQYVHAIDFETGYILATLVVFGQSSGTVGGSTHAVLVV